MTENDTIKALGCGKSIECKDCPYRDVEMCLDKVCEDALSIINRQKAEIAEYQKHIDQDIIYQKAVEVEAIKGFAEKLKEDVTYFEDECGNFVPFVDCRDIEKLLETIGEKV